VMTDRLFGVNRYTPIVAVRWLLCGEFEHVQTLSEDRHQPYTYLTEKLAEKFQMSEKHLPGLRFETFSPRTNLVGKRTSLSLVKLTYANWENEEPLSIGNSQSGTNRRKKTKLRFVLAIFVFALPVAAAFAFTTNHEGMDVSIPSNTQLDSRGHHTGTTIRELLTASSYRAQVANWIAREAVSKPA
jgi:hypothetical protein